MKKDLAKKIDESLGIANSLTELERMNPLQLKDYCYRDGAPTDWGRSEITQRDIQRQMIPYYCLSCQDRSYYQLKYNNQKPKRRES